MSKQKTMPIRFEEKVRHAINIIAGDLQVKSGESISASEGLWKFIEEHAPDIAKRAEALASRGEGKGK